MYTKTRCSIEPRSSIEKPAVEPLQGRGGVRGGMVIERCRMVNSVSNRE